MINKNAIVVLTRGYNNNEQYQHLIIRNIKISENIINKVDEKFDILIFHEGNINTNHQKFISSYTPELNLTFINVKENNKKNAFDDSLNKVNLKLCPPTVESKMFPLGYKHMCHFWSIDFLNFLQDYKYVIRIDEDCFVENFDVEVLQKMNKDEVYFISPYFQGHDEWFVTVGMKELWVEFVSENKITPIKKYEDITCPYTNFMIFDIEYIKNNLMICRFLEKIDKSHGIYSNRWGDLPIWGMIISTLVDDKKYLENKLISYYHGSHNKIINKN